MELTTQEYQAARKEPDTFQKVLNHMIISKMCYTNFPIDDIMDLHEKLNSNNSTQ
jgi:hypothetical protein